MTNSDWSITLLILTAVIPFLLVVLNKLRMDLAGLLIAVLLGFYQLVGLQVLGPAHSPTNAMRSISGFSQPVVITLIALYIFTFALEKTGITRWFAQYIIGLGKGQTSTYILIFSATSALLSLVMNNLAAGAILLPSAIHVSRKTHIRASKLLIPIAYGSLLGGSATLFTTANIIMSDILVKATPSQMGLRFQDFFPTGGLIAVAGILFLWLAGDKLLPNHNPSLEQAQAQLTGKELEDFFQIGDRLWEGRVLNDSPYAYHSIRENQISQKWGVTVAAIRHGKDFLLPIPDQVLHPDDWLILVGRQEKVQELGQNGLVIQAFLNHFYLTENGISVVEIIISPHSHYLGQTIEQIQFRNQFGLTVIGIKRIDRSYRTDVGKLFLQAGDSLLAIGTSQQIKATLKYSDFIVLETNPSDEPLRPKPVGVVLSILACAVIASILGVPVYLAMLFGSVLIVLLGQVSLDEVYRSIHWQTVFIIAGLSALSTAIIESGLANRIGDLIQPLSSLGLPVFATGMYFLSALFTQIIGGQVAALVTGPIAIGAAISVGLNPRAIAVATAIGCSASFLSPLAHPVNILMIGPANYTFRDFFRIGIWLSLLSMLMLTIGMILFW